MQSKKVHVHVFHDRQEMLTGDAVKSVSGVVAGLYRRMKSASTEYHLYANTSPRWSLTVAPESH
jgi:hypothetical protein